MLIGSVLKERIDAFGFTPEVLADRSFVDLDVINDLLSDKLPIENVDSFDLEMLEESLYCQSGYLKDKSIRSTDVIKSALNRGIGDKDSNIVKGKIQQFAEDLDFLLSL